MAEMRACPTCPNRRAAEDAEARAAQLREKSEAVAERAEITRLGVVAMEAQAESLEAQAEAAEGSRVLRPMAAALRSRAAAWRQRGAVEARRAIVETAQSTALEERANAEVDRAEKIRAAGCQWLWNVWVEGKDGQPEPRTECGSTHMVTALNKLGSEVKLASRTIQDDRNEQAKAIEKIEAAIAEKGGGEVLQALGRVGLVTVQSGLQKQGRPRELPEAAEGAPTDD